MGSTTRSAATQRTSFRLIPFGIFVILASLDNAAVGVLPPLYALLADKLNSNEAALGFLTGGFILVAAAAAVLWGYWGDRGRRKWLLLLNTFIWVTALGLCWFVETFAQFAVLQLITAVGVGGVGSLGFSVVSDYVPAGRRGLALSLWSISQALGSGFGAGLASTIGAFDWRYPFLTLATLGLIFGILFLLTDEPKRGQAEPELAAVFESGQRYTHRISLADIRHILSQKTNRWLLGYSFTFALAYGSTLWIPRWAIARVQAEGFDLQTATIIGNFFFILFNAGTIFSVVAGHVGDLLQKRSPRGRTLLGSFGVLGSIPFLIMLYFLPLRGVQISPDGNLFDIALAVLISLFSNGWVALAFTVSFLGTALISAAPPSWAATMTDVNLPEHRGTMVGISRVTGAVGNAVSVALAGWAFVALTAVFPEPTNFAVGLTIFQVLAIPAGLCFLWVSRHVQQDREGVTQTLRDRARMEIVPALVLGSEKATAD